MRFRSYLSARSGTNSMVRSLGSPEDIAAATKFKARWKCENNHQYEQRIDSRIKFGCAKCSLKANSLQILYPEIARLWHPTKNKDLGPDAIAAGSNKKVWWQCDKNIEHVWQATPGSKTAFNQKCPFCTNKKVNKTNSLATLRADLAAEWHPTRNGALTPDKVVCGSHTKVWWSCSKAASLGLKHEWLAEVKGRANQGYGCPMCPRDYTAGDNQLSKKFPDIAAEWHPTKNRLLYPTWQKETQTGDGVHKPKTILKNRRLRPSDVPPFSNESVWWQCRNDKTHEWEAPISPRTKKNRGCPLCAGRRVTKDHNFEAKYPKLAKVWHPTRNLPLRPSDVTPGSSKIVWWRCFKCADHVWQAEVAQIAISRRAGESGCPFCKGRRVASDNNLAAKYPGLLSQWNTQRNEPLKPNQVTAGCGTVVWWKCQKVKEHEWQASVNRVVQAFQKGHSGCSICASRIAAPGNSLEARFPKLAKQWHPARNGSLQPSQVTAASMTKVWWQCPDFEEHFWEATVNSARASHLRGTSGCPDCGRVLKTNALMETNRKKKAARPRDSL